MKAQLVPCMFVVSWFVAENEKTSTDNFYDAAEI